MRNAALAFSFASLVLLACSSSAGPEKAASTDDALGIVSRFDWRTLPPPAGMVARPSATLITGMPDTTCPDIATWDGTLHGRTGYEWMQDWGLGSPWAYYQGVFQLVKSENTTSLTLAMQLGWTPFCAYTFVAAGAAPTVFDYPVPWYHTAALQAAGATSIAAASTPSWPMICQMQPLNPPCPNAPCTCPPVD